MTEKKVPDVVRRFSRESIAEKQREAKEAFETKADEARKIFEQVVGTPSGEKMLRYIFLLCGGNTKSIRRDSDSRVSTDETLIFLGAKGVWEEMRTYFSSDLLKKLERQEWEK